MGSNYQKDLYKQLMEVMAKVDSLESEQKQNKKEIQHLTSEITSLRKENAALREEVSSLKQENAVLTEKCAKLEKEKILLRNDNERMKRILNNDSTNSSIPPSKDEDTKSVNTYNSRKPTSRKSGAQKGHKGVCLSKADVEEKIKKGLYKHRIEEIGIPGRPYITRYRLDLEVETMATEIRIYADEAGKYQVPLELKGDVTYGRGIKAIAAFLYSEGVVANDRICTFLNSISGGSLDISEGSIYHFCRDFSVRCREACNIIENALLNASEICTDATTVSTNGKQTYIRNFSTEKCVLYCGSAKKDLNTLCGLPVLGRYTGILTHDHETAYTISGRDMGNATSIWDATCAKIRRRHQTDGAMTWKCF